MSIIVKFNNKILRLNNKTVGWTSPVPPPVLYHVTTNAINGTVVATPNTGYNGDTITLSNTPDAGYEFDSYSLTGATLYDTNKFDIDNSDVNVVGNFILGPEPVDIEPGYFGNNGAGWYKSQLTNVSSNYNSTYKFVSDNWPTGSDHFWGVFYDSSWNQIGDYDYYAYASNNYKFSLSDMLTETQYNNLNYFTVNLLDAANNELLMPSDIKMQLL